MDALYGIHTMGYCTRNINNPPKHNAGRKKPGSKKHDADIAVKGQKQTKRMCAVRSQDSSYPWGGDGMWGSTGGAFQGLGTGVRSICTNLSNSSFVTCTLYCTYVTLQ